MERTRREFISETTTLLAGAALLADAPSLLAAPAPPVSWQVGCMNRPWTKWSFDDTLKAIKAAGYDTIGLLTPTKDDPFIGPEATPEYLGALKRKIAASGLAANMGSIHSRFDTALDETVKSLQKEIDNAAFLGLKYVITFGVDQPAQVEQYLQSMARAAAYGADKGVQVVMKPHGGSSGASSEIIAAMKKVNQPNFKIWYDAGNIIYYTGKDPVEELKPVVEYVTGFCAKDCAAPQSEVMIQFGTGKVDFAGVFKVMKAAGFGGPIMVECCAIGETPEATGANAHENRVFLEKVLASI